MKIAYFDCIAGASGDMILGALVDAGLPSESLQNVIDALGLAEAKLRCQRVLKGGFGATKVDVLVADDVPERHLSDIEAMVRDKHPDLFPSARASEKLVRQVLAWYTEA